MRWSEKGAEKEVASALVIRDLDPFNRPRIRVVGWCETTVERPEAIEPSPVLDSE